MCILSDWSCDDDELLDGKRSSVRALAKMGEAENWKEIVINFNTNSKEEIWFSLIFLPAVSLQMRKVIGLMIATPLPVFKPTDIVTFHAKTTGK